MSGNVAPLQYLVAVVRGWHFLECGQSLPLWLVVGRAGTPGNVPNPRARSAAQSCGQLCMFPESLRGARGAPGGWVPATQVEGFQSLQIKGSASAALVRCVGGRKLLCFLRFCASGCCKGVCSTDYFD
jgi:hypothetical protein